MREEWEDMFDHRTSCLITLGNLFVNFKENNAELLEKFVTSCVKQKRIQNIDFLIRIIELLMHFNENGPLKGTIGDKIDDMKNLIRSNQNRNWRFDVDVRN